MPKTVTVQFDVDVPDDAADHEVKDWVSFCVGATAQLDGDNTMADLDLSAIHGSVSVR